MPGLQGHGDFPQRLLRQRVAGVHPRQPRGPGLPGRGGRPHLGPLLRVEGRLGRLLQGGPPAKAEGTHQAGQSGRGVLRVPCTVSGSLFAIIADLLALASLLLAVVFMLV